MNEKYQIDSMRANVADAGAGKTPKINPHPTAAQQLKAQAYAEEEHRRHVEDLHKAFSVTQASLVAALAENGKLIHHHMQRQGFWTSDNTGEKIALMHSELSEALEAHRKNLPSDHVPNLSGLEEEMADTVIRILDFCAYHRINLGDVIIQKMHFNLERPYKHGKAY